MPAPAFASVTDLRALLGKTRESLPDEQARVILDVVSAAIRRECGWALSAEVVVGEVFHASGRASIWLPTLWLTSVDAVSENGVALIDGVHYAWSREGRINRNAVFGWGDGPVVVSYTHGYPPGSRQIADLRTVALSAASRVPGNPQSLRSWTVGNESLTAAGAGGDLTNTLTTSEKRDLDPYRLEWM